MKKRNNNIKSGDAGLHNPVAKFAYRFNKAHVFGDKSKYTRKNKHNKQETAPSIFSLEFLAQPFAV